MKTYPRQPIARRVMRAALESFHRFKAIDMLLFFILMLIKLYVFDTLIHVPNMRMDVYDAKVAVGTLMLLSFWTIWLPTRGRIMSLAIIHLMLTFVIYADLIYFRYFQDFISVPVLMQAGQVDSLGESIGTLLHAKDLWLFVDWLLIVPFAVYTLWKGRADLIDSFGGRRHTTVWQKAAVRGILSVVIFSIGFSLSIANINEAKRTWAIGLFDSNWWNVSLYNVTGIVGFHGYDVYRYAKQHWLNSEVVSAEATAEALRWTESKGDLRKQLEQDPFFGAYKDSNVIMVQAEAFQNFMIGKSIGGLEVTPNMNKLIEESAYFDQFYQQTSQGRTSDADFLSNCSLQPVANGSVFIQYANHSFNCMPQTLKEQGYQTTVFHAYEGGFWNRNSMYANMDYDTFYSKKHFTIDEPIGWSLGDQSFFRQSMDVIAEQQQPFYSFLITLSSHHPYTIPKDNQKLELGELEGTIMGDYLQSIHYLDQSLGSLIDRLKKEGLWNNTIFALYGDHDNSIKDWSMFETFLNKPLNELEQQMILKQVPFILHLPDGAYAGTHSTVGGQIDITPTIMHLLGISTADQTLIGTPLITENEQTDNKLVALRNGFFTDGSFYFIPSSDGIAENGACWNIAANAVGELAPCLNAAEEARTEIAISDQIVIHDLIASFDSYRAVEANAGSSIEAAEAIGTSQ